MGELDTYNQEEENAFIEWCIQGLVKLTRTEAKESIKKDGVNRIFIFGFRKGRELERADVLKSLDAKIAEEKQLVKAICIGLVHPDQSNQKEFTEWLQDTVIFHLDDFKKKLRKETAGVDGRKTPIVR